MSVTRKDFIAIAEALKSARMLAAIPTQPQHTDGCAAVDSAAAFIASHLASRNPAFDRKRFLKACGVPS